MMRPTNYDKPSVEVVANTKRRDVKLNFNSKTFITIKFSNK